MLSPRRRVRDGQGRRGPARAARAGGNDGSRGTGHRGTRIVAVTTTPRARTQ